MGCQRFPFILCNNRKNDKLYCNAISFMLWLFYQIKRWYAIFKVIKRKEEGYRQATEYTVYSTLEIDGELMFVLYSYPSWVTVPADLYIPAKVQ